MNRKDFIKSIGAVGAGIGAIWKLEQEMQPEPKEIEPPEYPKGTRQFADIVSSFEPMSVHTTADPRQVGPMAYYRRIGSDE